MGRPPRLVALEPLEVHHHHVMMNMTWSPGKSILKYRQWNWYTIPDSQLTADDSAGSANDGIRDPQWSQLLTTLNVPLILLAIHEVNSIRRVMDAEEQSDDVPDDTRYQDVSVLDVVLSGICDDIFFPEELEKKGHSVSNLSELQSICEFLANEEIYYESSVHLRLVLECSRKSMTHVSQYFREKYKIPDPEYIDMDCEDTLEESLFVTKPVYDVLFGYPHDIFQSLSTLDPRFPDSYPGLHPNTTEADIRSALQLEETLQPPDDEEEDEDDEASDYWFLRPGSNLKGLPGLLAYLRERKDHSSDLSGFNDSAMPAYCEEDDRPRPAALSSFFYPRQLGCSRALYYLTRLGYHAVFTGFEEDQEQALEWLRDAMHEDNGKTERRSKLFSTESPSSKGDKASIPLQSPLTCVDPSAFVDSDHSVPDVVREIIQREFTSMPSPDADAQSDAEASTACDPVHATSASLKRTKQLLAWDSMRALTCCPSGPCGGGLKDLIRGGTAPAWINEQANAIGGYPQGHFPPGVDQLFNENAFSPKLVRKVPLLARNEVIRVFFEIQNNLPNQTLATPDATFLPPSSSGNAPSGHGRLGSPIAPELALFLDTDYGDTNSPYFGDMARMLLSLDPRVLLDSASFEPNNGYYSSGQHGLFNTTTCSIGRLPLFHSLPYFLGGSRTLNTAVNIPRGNLIEHVPYSVVEPGTGMLLSGHERLQLNLLLPLFSGHYRDDQNKHVHPVFFPLLWTDEWTVASSSLLSEFDNEVQRPQRIARYSWIASVTGIALFSLAAVATAAFGVHHAIQARKKKDSDEAKYTPLDGFDSGSNGSPDNIGTLSDGESTRSVWLRGNTAILSNILGEITNVLRTNLFSEREKQVQYRNTSNSVTELSTFPPNSTPLLRDNTPTSEPRPALRINSPTLPSLRPSAVSPLSQRSITDASETLPRATPRTIINNKRKKKGRHSGVLDVVIEQSLPKPESVIKAEEHSHVYVNRPAPSQHSSGRSSPSTTQSSGRGSPNCHHHHNNRPHHAEDPLSCCSGAPGADDLCSLYSGLYAPASQILIDPAPATPRATSSDSAMSAKVASRSPSSKLATPTFGSIAAVGQKGVVRVDDTYFKPPSPRPTAANASRKALLATTKPGHVPAESPISNESANMVADKLSPTNKSESVSPKGGELRSVSTPVLSSASAPITREVVKKQNPFAPQSNAPQLAPTAAFAQSPVLGSSYQTTGSYSAQPPSFAARSTLSMHSLPSATTLHGSALYSGSLRAQSTPAVLANTNASNSPSSLVSTPTSSEQSLMKPPHPNARRVFPAVNPRIPSPFALPLPSTSPTSVPATTPNPQLAEGASSLGTSSFGTFSSTPMPAWATPPSTSLLSLPFAFKAPEQSTVIPFPTQHSPFDSSSFNLPHNAFVSPPSTSLKRQPFPLPTGSSTFAPQKFASLPPSSHVSASATQSTEPIPHVQSPFQPQAQLSSYSNQPCTNYVAQPTMRPIARPMRPIDSAQHSNPSPSSITPAVTSTAGPVAHSVASPQMGSLVNILPSSWSLTADTVNNQSPAWAQSLKQTSASMTRPNPFLGGGFGSPVQVGKVGKAFPPVPEFSLKSTQ